MQAAVVRCQDDVFLVRRGNVGEARIVVQAMSDDISEGELKLVNSFANAPHDSLKMTYIPHPPLAIAELIAHSFRGEVIGYTRYVGPPIPEEEGIVY